MTGFVTAWLKVSVIFPRPWQRATLTKHPVAITSMSDAFVVVEIAGDSIAAVTPPVALKVVDALNTATFAPERAMFIVVPPGNVLVTGAVPADVAGVWLARTNVPASKSIRISAVYNHVR